MGLRLVLLKMFNVLPVFRVAVSRPVNLHTEIWRCGFSHYRRLFQAGGKCPHRSLLILISSHCRPEYLSDNALRSQVTAFHVSVGEYAGVFDFMRQRLCVHAEDLCNIALGHTHAEAVLDDVCCKRHIATDTIAVPAELPCFQFLWCFFVKTHGTPYAYKVA